MRFCLGLAKYRTKNAAAPAYNLMLARDTDRDVQLLVCNSLMSRKLRPEVVMCMLPGMSNMRSSSGLLSGDASTPGKLSPQWLLDASKTSALVVRCLLAIMLWSPIIAQ